MNGLNPKLVTDLNLSHNAFGPDGVRSFEEFLTKVDNLRVLNVTNCGLGPVGGKMIADAILQNSNMRLVEFSACRDRLEEEGMAAMG